MIASNVVVVAIFVFVVVCCLLFVVVVFVVVELLLIVAAAAVAAVVVGVVGGVVVVAIIVCHLPGIFAEEVGQDGPHIDRQPCGWGSPACPQQPTFTSTSSSRHSSFDPARTSCTMPRWH